jgi:hypothetical protein
MNVKAFAHARGAGKTGIFSRIAYSRNDPAGMPPQASAAVSDGAL